MKNHKSTILEKWIKKLKDNKLIAFTVILYLFAYGFIQFINALDGITGFFGIFTTQHGKVANADSGSKSQIKSYDLEELRTENNSRVTIESISIGEKLEFVVKVGRVKFSLVQLDTPEGAEVIFQDQTQNSPLIFTDLGPGNYKLVADDLINGRVDIFFTVLNVSPRREENKGPEFEKRRNIWVIPILVAIVMIVINISRLIKAIRHICSELKKAILYTCRLLKRLRKYSVAAPASEDKSKNEEA